MHFDKEDISPKNDALAIFLAIMFGFYGAHRFYAGKYLSACIYLFAGNIHVLYDILEYFGVAPEANVFLTVFFYGLPFVMIAYDVFALLNASFLDGDKKVIVNRAIKEEAGAFDKNEDRITDIIIAVCCFGLYIIIKYILLPIFI